MLDHQPLTLLVFLATLVLTVILYLFIPKGFFPEQDTGLIQGISEAPQSVSFDAMSQRSRALAEAILRTRRWTTSPRSSAWTAATSRSTPGAC